MVLFTGLRSHHRQSDAFEVHAVESLVPVEDAQLAAGRVKGDGRGGDHGPFIALGVEVAETDRQADGFGAAERVVGLHFFNPPPLMALVEVIRAVQTTEVVAQTAYSLMTSWGKRPVWAKDTPGFIVNRVARPFYGEALRLLDEGIADMATIDWAMTRLAGFRMGPFTLMDYIGHDVNYKVTESVFASFYNDPRYKPSFTQLRLLEAGHLGRKTGRGFYDYREGAVMPVATEDERLGWLICNRILAMLINEAADACHWGVASREDIDLAVTLGLNYPKGLFAWAGEWGVANVVSQLDYLYEQYREDRYRCSPLLRRMAREEG